MQVAVVDEAHYMKNTDSAAFKDFKSLKVFSRLLLTGTPIQMGKVGDKHSAKFIFGLLTIVGGTDQPHFQSFEAFTARFGTLDDQAQVKDLYECLQVCMLRRKKEDVETTIPRKEETVIEVELTTSQVRHYRGILEHEASYLRESAKRNVHHKLSNIAMELRKICNHPFLIGGAREELVTTAEEQTPGLVVDMLVKHSGKFILLDKLLPKLRSGGHKVLIFSQFKIVLNLIEEYLFYKQYPFERLDGDTSANERQRGIDRFSAADSEGFIFLLSTRAGGLGINLVAADTAIIFDSDWNPQNDLQAQARCHRIGQKKEVKIYRFVSRNTYEEQMFEQSLKKLGLDRVLRQHELGGENGSAAMNQQELQNMLRNGVRGVFSGTKEEQVARSDKFRQSDIDQILKTSSRVVEYDTGDQNNVLSKASFVADDSGAAVEMDDPEFWSKLFPDAGTSATKMRESLSSIATTTSDDVIASVFAKIEVMALAVVDERANGQMPQQYNEVLALLDTVQGHDAFSADHRKKCAEWYQSIEKPKRKRKQFQPNAYYKEDGEDKDERGDEYDPEGSDAEDGGASLVTFPHHFPLFLVTFPFICHHLILKKLISTGEDEDDSGAFKESSSASDAAQPKRTLKDHRLWQEENKIRKEVGKAMKVLLIAVERKCKRDQKEEEKRLRKERLLENQRRYEQASRNEMRMQAEQIQAARQAQEQQQMLLHRRNTSLQMVAEFPQGMSLACANPQCRAQNQAPTACKEIACYSCTQSTFAYEYVDFDATVAAFRRQQHLAATNPALATQIHTEQQQAAAQQLVATNPVLANQMQQQEQAAAAAHAALVAQQQQQQHLHLQQQHQQQQLQQQLQQQTASTIQRQQQAVAVHAADQLGLTQLNECFTAAGAISRPDTGPSHWALWNRSCKTCGVVRMVCKEDQCEHCCERLRTGMCPAHFYFLAAIRGGASSSGGRSASAAAGPAAAAQASGSASRDVVDLSTEDDTADSRPQVAAAAPMPQSTLSVRDQEQLQVYKALQKRREQQMQEANEKKQNRVQHLAYEHLQQIQQTQQKQHEDHAGTNWMDVSLVYNFVKSEWAMNQRVSAWVKSRKLSPITHDVLKHTAIPSRELSHVKEAYQRSMELLVKEPKFRIMPSVDFRVIEQMACGLQRYLRTHMPAPPAAPHGTFRSEFCVGGSILATYAGRDTQDCSDSMVMVLCPSAQFLSKKHKADSCHRHCNIELDNAMVFQTMCTKLELKKCVAMECCYGRRPFYSPAEDGTGGAAVRPGVVIRRHEQCRNAPGYVMRSAPSPPAEALDTGGGGVAAQQQQLQPVPTVLPLSQVTMVR